MYFTGLTYKFMPIYASISLETTFTQLVYIQFFFKYQIDSFASFFSFTTKNDRTNQIAKHVFMCILFQ